MVKRKSPFDMFGDFDGIFEEMLREMEDMEEQGERTSGPVFYGFSMSQRPGEEPEVREFGNVHAGKGQFEIGERKPLIDVFENEKTVQVVAEMPGIEKEDVELSIEGRDLDIHAQRRKGSTTRPWSFRPTWISTPRRRPTRTASSRSPSTRSRSRKVEKRSTSNKQEGPVPSSYFYIRSLDR